MLSPLYESSWSLLLLGLGMKTTFLVVIHAGGGFSSSSRSQAFPASTKRFLIVGNTSLSSLLLIPWGPGAELAFKSLTISSNSLTVIGLVSISSVSGGHFLALSASSSPRYCLIVTAPTVWSLAVISLYLSAM